MAQVPDTSAIHRLVRGTRFRIRTQWALDGATTATILAAATALVAIFAVRMRMVSPSIGIVLLIAAGAVIIVGAVIAAARRLDDELVARRIDRASNLSDRLSTAIAFERAIKTGAPVDPDMTHELMHAAIRDGVRAAPRANIRAASPFTRPRDLGVALLFLAASALAAGLAIRHDEVKPHCTRAFPERVRQGGTTMIEGDHLLEGLAAPIASRPIDKTLGAPNVPTPTAKPERGYVPTGGNVYLGTLAGSRPVTVLDWTATRIKVRIPDDAPIGKTSLLVFIANKKVGVVNIEVLSKKDISGHPPDAVALDPDEKAYVEAIIGELKDLAKRDDVPELTEFAHKIEALLEKAENGEITKEQLLQELQKAEEALSKDPEPNQAEVKQQMAEMGKELAKEKITKELGDALKKNDLQKAKQELEKLAEKLDKKELSEKEKEQLSKQLEKVAEQMEKQDKQQEQKQDQQQQKLEEEIRRLEKQKDKAKNEKERQELERRLEEKKRELKKMEKEQEAKEQSEQRRALKRLQKDLEKAAESLSKPKKDQQGKDQQDQQEQQQKEQQASQKLKDAARETGRVDQDQRKQAAQQKTSSQMDDLREAMRRAKQRGSKGPNDPFNKNGKNQDFIARARGQKGSGQAWKPGQGQGQGQGKGQGQGQNGGQGSGSGQSSTWGVGHDDNLVGDPTQKSGNTKDQDVQGKAGDKGGSTRETILSAAQKGFASKRYQKVYQDYQRIVEEVMRTEKLPSSYKYYVKRYFAKIHPNVVTEESDK